MCTNPERSPKCATQAKSYEVHVIVHSTMVIKVEAVDAEQAVNAAQRVWQGGDSEPDDPHFADWGQAEVFIEGST